MCSDGEAGTWYMVLQKKKKKSIVSKENLKISNNARSQSDWIQPKIVKFPDAFVNVMSKCHESDFKKTCKIQLLYIFKIRKL